MTRARIGIVLAAGKGTRLKSNLPKVLHPVLGKSMLQRVLENLAPLGLDRVILVVGHQANRIEEHIATLKLPFPITSVLQEPQLGTGHALMQVAKVLPQETEAEALIACGDMPLVPAERYKALLEAQSPNRGAVALAAVELSNPAGYGRVIVENGQFRRIVEEKDATPEEKQVRLGNAGIYAVDWPLFSKHLALLNQNNAQGEFYLTDVMEILARQSDCQSVSVVTWPDEEEILGINSRHHLAQAAEILSKRTAQRLMEEGVSLIQPSSMTLAPEIRIGADSLLHPGCYLVGDIRIGSSSEIGPYTTMRGDITIGDHCRVVHSFLERAVTIGSGSYVGPFAHLRDNTIVGEQVRVGNFVEMKESRFGSRSNAAHLCYMGDADIGDEVNMGAGSIVANYDPVRDIKHRTTIAEGVKVGCNSVLVAPVTLGQRSCIAAGSVITQDIAPWDLAIARSRQVTIARWVEKALASDAGKSNNPSCPMS